MKQYLLLALLINQICCVPLVIPLKAQQKDSRKICFYEDVRLKNEILYKREQCVVDNFAYYTDLNFLNLDWSLQLQGENPLVIVDSKFIEKVQHINQMNKATSRKCSIKYHKMIDDVAQLVVEGNPESTSFVASPEKQGLLSILEKKSERESFLISFVNAVQIGVKINNTRKNKNTTDTKTKRLPQLSDQDSVDLVKSMLKEQENEFQGIFGLGLFRNRSAPANNMNNFMNTLITVQVLDRHDSKDKKMQTSLIFHKGSLNSYEDNSIIKYKSSFSNLNGRMQLMLSKFSIDVNGHPNDNALITNAELVFSFNTKNVQVTEQQFLLIQQYMQQSLNIDCTMGDTQVSCANVENPDGFRNIRIYYWIAEHDENDPITIRLEHIVDRCYNPKYEIPKRHLQQKSKKKSISQLNKEYKNSEKQFKKVSNDMESTHKSKPKKNSVTCVLNMNVQSPMDGQLVIGIPVFENKRIIFDKTQNIIGIGHAKQTFSLIGIAKKSIEGFMKIFKSKSKKDQMQFGLEEQSQNNGQVQEVSKISQYSNYIFKISLFLVPALAILFIIYCIVKKKFRNIFRSDASPFMNSQHENGVQHMELQNPHEVTHSSGNMQTDIEDMMRKRLEFNNDNYQIVEGQQNSQNGDKRQL